MTNLPSAATTPVVEKKPAVHESSHVNLKVKSQDGTETPFKIKWTSPLEVLMREYCTQMSLELNSIVFLLDGRPIRAHQTPDQLEMEDGDLIDAMLHQTGGAII
ncbi:E3 ubiquitin-protein ligase parkin [Trema orientale]|uniref:Small ubiquitin-related modifier n=1 Tax=Trema orientale TaxID=63057 RepID=A0A2P5F2A1_TREOI|nr:E3 ubiquitin-protein ligase parkin [Trema orientale]